MQNKGKTGKTFEQWFSQVNAEISRKTGLTTDDLPDMCYLEMYEDGLTAPRAARKAIKNAGGD